MMLIAEKDSAGLFGNLEANSSSLKARKLKSGTPTVHV
jgi:hypothetical protein